MNIGEILALVPGGCASVEVIGAGAFADELRARLDDRARQNADARPCAIIDTSGEEAALVAALQRVDDLGTVVLAGPQPASPLTLDLYADLHVRGLTIVGLA